MRESQRDESVADGLVQPEGVDAASEQSTAEGPETAEGPGTAAHQDVRAGGDPEQAPSPEEAAPWRTPDDGELAGAPGTGPQDPGQEAAPPGQDTGSGT